MLNALWQTARATGKGTSWDLFSTDAFPYGDVSDVLGVGVTTPEERGPWGPPSLQPTLFVAGDDAWKELGSVPVQFDMSHGAGTAAGRVSVVSVPRPLAFAATGDRCDSNVAWGTLGARVTAKSGRDAVLIAGHVGDSTGTVVSDQAGNVLGKVAECVHPGQVPPQTPSGDVAVVELDGGVVVGGVPHATVVATVLPRDDVEIHGAATGVTTTWVRGASPFWVGPDPAAGDWASVLVTRDGTTTVGDSGALALVPGTMGPVGHVVGGVPGVYTLIQELDEQLQWMGRIPLR